MRITFLNPISMFLRFKYPEATASDEDMAELRAVFAQLVFLLCNWTHSQEQNRANN